MNAEILKIIPVLPSADIARDIAWYQEKAGFETSFFDHMYAVLYREKSVIHLQWHANTAQDPLLGGSVIRILVKNVNLLFEECIKRGTVTRADFKANTPWRTNEFGFHDLNKNVIFMMEETN